MAGYSLSRFKTIGQQAAGLTLLASKTLPSSLIVIPFFIMFTTFHLINSKVALVLANASVGVPFADLADEGLFRFGPARAGGGGADRRLHAARRALAGDPAARPAGRGSVGDLSRHRCLVDLVFARTLVTDQSQWQFTIGLQSFISEYQVEWANLMAAGLLSLIPVVILFLLLEPFLVSELTTGAVNR